MLRSVLDDSITYTRQGTISPEDVSHETEVFTIFSGRKSAEIAFGKVRNTYADKGVLYMPMYEVVGNLATSDVGVYEFQTNDDGAISSGTLDVDKMGDPLLFDEASLFSKPGSAEAEIIDNQEEGYIPMVDSPWVAKLFEDNEFALRDNEGGGDCLFAVIRDALEMIGRVVTVEELREKLANAVDEQTYLNYASISDSIAAAESKLELELSSLSKTHKTLETRAKKDLDLETKTGILKEARRTEAAYERGLAERKLNKELQEEYGFMAKVKTFDDFKAALKSCDFWADTWAITTLERALNVKMVILSEEAFNQGDVDNCLLCGQVNDADLQKIGTFRPDVYIITSFGQSHYRLVTFKRRGAFTFAELPSDVKELIISKCMEKGAGPFSIIPEFKSMKSLTTEDKVTSPISEKKETDGVVFQLYDKSNAAAHPGKGAGEKIPVERRKDFALLHKKKNWRRKLDNSWIAPFDLDGKTWASVDHFVEAQRFSKSSPEFFEEFTAQSGSKLSQSSAMARAAGKNGKVGGKKILPKGVLPDPTITSAALQDARVRAADAKFKTHSDLAELLSLTKNARLMHYIKGQPPRHLIELEAARGR